MSRNDAIVGVSDHGGWAILVTAARDGTLLDRRRVELVDEGLPKIPHHSECQKLPLDQAVPLVERVRVSAERRAKLVLDAVAATLPGRIRGIALRNCPQLPPTIAERIKNYRAQNVADWVMYRQALHFEDLDAHFLQLRRSIGPPWNMDHKLAIAAAIVAATPR